LLQQVYGGLTQKQIDKIENIDKPYKIGILVLIFDMFVDIFLALLQNFTIFFEGEIIF